jgi:hypothetical protein
MLFYALDATVEKLEPPCAVGPCFKKARMGREVNHEVG